MQLLSKTVALLFIVGVICSPVGAREFVIVKTRSIPIVEEILQGFISVCSDQYELTSYDMQGSLHEGQRIVSQIEDKISQQTISAIFTIGLPATTLISQSISDVPLFFSMVRSPEQRNLSNPNISGIAHDLPAEIQLKTIKRALPQAKKIALIYSAETSVFYLSEFMQAAKTYNLVFNRYPISSVKQVPKTLRQVILENDVLMLLPDKMVINQSTVEYIVTTTLENGFPTISYNKYLVKTGLLMALTPNHSAIGQQAGELLCKSAPQPAVINRPKHFEFSVNAKTARTIRTTLAPDIVERADYVY